MKRPNTSTTLGLLVTPALAGAVALALLVVLASATGCSYGPYEGYEDEINPEDYPRIVASREIFRTLRFSPATVEPSTLSRPMRVTVPVRTTYRSTDLNVQYRFVFLDAAGRPIERSTQAQWRFVTLPPLNQVFLDGNALDLGATDWRLEVRLAE